MASSNFTAFLAMFLVFLPMIAMGDGLSPILSPILDNLCDEVECGKGSCKAGFEYKFNFICECETGWKRTRLDNEDGLQYLPCVIPNCTLDYSCMAAPPPVPANPYNESVFDPCYWTYCGEGTCTKSSTYMYKCQCDTGYYNLLNETAFPCYSDCALGSDCGRLGIKVSNSSSSTPDSTPDSGNDSNQGSSFLPGKFHWITVFMVSTAVALWR